MLCLEHCSISSSLLSFGSVSARATEEMPMVFVGIDWAEAHHDICVVDDDGQVLAKRRVPEGIEGVGKLHALIAEHAEDPAGVVVGIETDRGLLVGSLVAACYKVYAINPLASSLWGALIASSQSWHRDRLIDYHPRRSCSWPASTRAFASFSMPS